MKISFTRLFLIGVLFPVVLLTAILPEPVDAVTQLDCADGTKLVRIQGYMGWNFACVDSKGKKVGSPTEKSVATCAPGYKRELSTWQGDQTDPTTAGNMCVPSSTAEPDQRHGEVGACEGTWSSMLNPFTCLTRALFAGIGGFLIWIGVLVLSIAAYIFEYVLRATVTQFPAYLYTPGVQLAIEGAWTGFRDIANILIIGMFVFIAINIILGNKTFGEKKMIARVLIIAVLINFSLLFTKMIVDGSNFTAVQFYNAMLQNTAAPLDKKALGKTDIDGTAVNSVGIASSFMGYLGVSGFGDSYAALRKIQEGKDNAFLALGYGVMSFIFLISVAAVLMYGAFLLVSRGLLIIFLLLMSSLAFATYLMPSNTIFVKKGWDLWWSSLLRTAVLAPLLMVMLWVTLNVSKAINAATSDSGGTIGALMTSGSPGANIGALFNFIIVLGLLFAAFKISSMFAHTVSGLNYASMVPGAAVAGASRVLGIAGRQTIGRAASATGAALEKSSKDTNKSLFARTLYDFSAQKAKGVAKRDFNAMRTPIGGVIQKATGIKKLDTLAGKKVGGFEATQKAIADSANARAQRITPSADDQKAKQKEEEQKEVQSQLALDSVLEKDHNDAKKEKETHQATHKTEQALLATIRDANSKEMTSLQAIVKEAEKAAAAGIGSSAAIRAAEDEMVAARTRQATAIDEQTTKIREAKDKIGDAERKRLDAENEAKQRAVDTGRLPSQPPSIKTRAQTAHDLVHSKFTSALFTKAENDRIARMATKNADLSERKERFNRSRGQSGDASTTAQSAQPAGGTT